MVSREQDCVHLLLMFAFAQTLARYVIKECMPDHFCVDNMLTFLQVLLICVTQSANGLQCFLPQARNSPIEVSSICKARR